MIWLTATLGRSDFRLLPFRRAVPAGAQHPIVHHNRQHTCCSRLRIATLATPHLSFDSGLDAHCSFGARTWKACRLIVILMGVQALGLAAAGIALDVGFFVFGGFFLAFGGIVNFFVLRHRVRWHFQHRPGRPARSTWIQPVT